MTFIIKIWWSVVYYSYQYMFMSCCVYTWSHTHTPFLYTRYLFSISNRSNDIHSCRTQLWWSTLTIRKPLLQSLKSTLPMPSNPKVSQSAATFVTNVVPTAEDVTHSKHRISSTTSFPEDDTEDDTEDDVVGALLFVYIPPAFRW